MRSCSSTVCWRVSRVGWRVSWRTGSTGSEGVRMWDLRHTQRALAEFSDESDQVSAVAVSGGKDSATMLYLLEQIRSRRLLPFDFDFVAVHLDQEQPVSGLARASGGELVTTSLKRNFIQ